MQGVCSVFTGPDYPTTRLDLPPVDATGGLLDTGGQYSQTRPDQCVHRTHTENMSLQCVQVPHALQGAQQCVNARMFRPVWQAIQLWGLCCALQVYSSTVHHLWAHCAPSACPSYMLDMLCGSTWALDTNQEEEEEEEETQRIFVTAEHPRGADSPHQQNHLCWWGSQLCAPVSLQESGKDRPYCWTVQDASQPMGLSPCGARLQTKVWPASRPLCLHLSGPCVPFHICPIKAVQDIWHQWLCFTEAVTLPKLILLFAQNS